MTHFDLIAFDADDTLWHNERLYGQTQARLSDLLTPYGVDTPTLEERLLATETRNIGLFGYGIKSFTLSMIEASVELTGGRISGKDILAILSFARAQLTAPVELLENVEEIISQLSSSHRMMIVTKGDLLDQQAKLDRSGLNKFFQAIEVVSSKTAVSYARLFKTHGLDPDRVLMVGDSIRSDILPILQLGGTAVYIPYLVTWQHEVAELPASGTPRFYQLSQIKELPSLLKKLESGQ